MRLIESIWVCVCVTCEHCNKWNEKTPLILGTKALSFHFRHSKTKMDERANRLRHEKQETSFPIWGLKGKQTAAHRLRH